MARRIAAIQRLQNAFAGRVAGETVLRRPGPYVQRRGPIQYVDDDEEEDHMPTLTPLLPVPATSFGADAAAGPSATESDDRAVAELRGRLFTLIEQYNCPNVSIKLWEFSNNCRLFICLHLDYYLHIYLTIYILIFFFVLVLILYVCLCFFSRFLTFTVTSSPGSAFRGRSTCCLGGAWM